MVTGWNLQFLDCSVVSWNRINFGYAWICMLNWLMIWYCICDCVKLYEEQKSPRFCLHVVKVDRYKSLIFLQGWIWIECKVKELICFVVFCWHKWLWCTKHPSLMLAENIDQVRVTGQVTDQVTVPDRVTKLKLCFVF